MSSRSPVALPSSPSSSREAQRAALLLGIGAWTMIVPYLGTALGLDVNVAAIVELVDHVIPGAIIVAAALYLHRLARRRPLAGERFALLAAGVIFLAGFWVLATHLPLVQDAADDRTTWEAAIWHSISALPIVGLAAWFVLRSIPES